MAKIKTREEWLTQGIVLLTGLFDEIKQKVPKNLKATCSFPSRGAFGSRKQTLGQCWYPPSVRSGKEHQLLISPVLEDPITVLDVLTHEMIHPIAGVKSGHHGQFKRIALEIGLEGKMTATVAGPELKQKLQRFAKALGPYPHSSLIKLVNGEKKQGTRLIKIECPECGYVCRSTRKWIDVGLPTCVCGSEMFAPSLRDEGEDDE